MVYLLILDMKYKFMNYHYKLNNFMNIRNILDLLNNSLIHIIEHK